MRPENCIIKQGKSIGNALVKGIKDVLIEADEGPAFKEFSIIPETAETKLVIHVAQALLSRHQMHSLQEYGAEDDFAVTCTVWEVLHGGPEISTLSDVCAAVGIGQTTLNKSVVFVHGVRQGQFLRIIRLTHVYELLSNCDDRPRPAKDAAMAQGIVHGGRLASDCRRLFGELPSETLKRSFRIQ